MANLIAAALFLVSAALQYNDPDPLRWVAIYGGAFAACLVAWRRPALPYLAWLVGGAALVWAATMAPRVVPDLRPGDLLRTMKAGTPVIEEGREMLGLLIVAGWMAVLSGQAARLRRRRGSA